MLLYPGAVLTAQRMGAVIPKWIMKHWEALVNCHCIEFEYLAEEGARALIPVEIYGELLHNTDSLITTNSYLALRDRLDEM